MYQVGQKVFVKFYPESQTSLRARVVALLPDGIRVFVSGQGKCLSYAEFRQSNLALVTKG